MTTAELITAECNAIKAMLLDKNARYGDSAMQPRRIFSKADHLEQLKVRIDDKLSRIAYMGPDGEDEDTTGDLIGYLVLLRIARRRARQGEVVDDTFEPWQSAVPEQDVQRREQVATGGHAAPTQERECSPFIPLQDGDDDQAAVNPGGGEAIADGCSRGDAWSWKMEYCKTHGLPPADAENWSRAERAFTRDVQRREQAATGSPLMDNIAEACGLKKADVRADFEGVSFDLDAEPIEPGRIYCVPDRTSRATLPDECLGALCGRVRG